MKQEYEIPGLADYYRQFEQGHEQLREQLMHHLPEARWSAQKPAGDSSRSFRQRRFWAVRTAVAAAAMVAIVCGLFLFNGLPSQQSSITWAATALQKAHNLESIHFIMTTPGPAKSSRVEMWWRKNGDFRMNISDLTIMTGNAEQRCIYNKRTNTVMIDDPGKGGLEMFILGQLGQLFASDYALASDWITQSKVISTTDITYKGEPCYKIVSELDGNRYEYIVDKEQPLIYEARQFGVSGRLLCHVQVLDINKPLDDSLFTVDLQDKKIKERRTNIKGK